MVLRSRHSRVAFHLGRVLAVAALSLPWPAWATDYYVSPTGNDAAPGTATQPWRTIARVNAVAFNPGDRIFFKGGSTFLGNLTFDRFDDGTATSPITVSSYGTGRAAINAGNGTGLFVGNAPGYVIRNLRLVGSGISNVGVGISFRADLTTNVKLPFVRIEDVEVSGFGGQGIAIGGGYGQTGYRDVRIVRAIVHDNAVGGISFYAKTRNVNENVYVGFSRVYQNPGSPNVLSNSGSGIILGGVNGGTVERCVVFGNGQTGWNPNAVWTYNSNAIVIQYNEAYGNFTAGSSDGGAFGLDQAVTNSKMQYNYSHDNQGPGYLLAHRYNDDGHSGNVIRYNISQNDARKKGGGIKVWGRVRNTEIYNNTVFISRPPNSTRQPMAIAISNANILTHYVNGLRIRNNIFQTTGGLALVHISTYALKGAQNLRFEGNSYFPTSSGFKIVWGSTTYGSLSAWRTAKGQEKIGTAAVGFDVNPLLTSPGGGGTIGDANFLGTLSAYKLRSTSPLVNKGLHLPLLFSVDPGTKDYYATPIPQTTQYDVGAHELKP